MKSNKVIIIVASLMLLYTVNLYAEPTTDEHKLFSQALESIVNDDIPKAIELFQNFVARYPQSELRPKAQEYIDMYTKRLDHSGIIGFYTGWLYTNVMVANVIPVLFEISDPLILSGTMILGVSSGILTSWALTKNQNMSLGQDLWIEFLEASIAINLGLTLVPIHSALFPNPDSYGSEAESIFFKSSISAVAAIAILSRVAAYNVFKDMNPSPDKIGFITQSYIWAHNYYWLAIAGNFQLFENPDLFCTLGIIIPDICALAAAYYADVIGWSYNRTGIVSIGGVGGGLIGSSLVLGLTSLLPNMSSQLSTGIILASTLAGQVITALLTEKMDNERPHVSAITSKSQFTVTPMVTQEGNFGIQGILSF